MPYPGKAGHQGGTGYGVYVGGRVMNGVGDEGLIQAKVRGKWKAMPSDEKMDFWGVEQPCCKKMNDPIGRQARKMNDPIDCKKMWIQFIWFSKAGWTSFIFCGRSGFLKPVQPFSLVRQLIWYCLGNIHKLRKLFLRVSWPPPPPMSTNISFWLTHLPPPYMIM